MDIKITEQNGITVLTISGNMDAVTVSDFNSEWKKALDDGVTKLVIEMSGLSYISSAGLRGILMLAKSAKPLNVGIVYAGMQSMVADMFKLSGFLSILVTCPDLDSAIAKLS